MSLSSMDDTKEFLSVGEAAEILEVSAQTLRRWEKSGAITALRTPGGQRRFRRADVVALIDTTEAAS